MTFHVRAAAGGAALAAILFLDIPWVVLNMHYGAYRGLVNGRVRHWAAVVAIWLLVAIVNAAAVSFVAANVSQWWTAFLSGMLLGLAVYGTFNGTALVTFNSWTWTAAGIDTLWGVLLFAAAAVASFLAANAVRSRSLFESATRHPASL